MPRVVELFREGGLEHVARRAVKKALVVAATPAAYVTVGRRHFDSPYGRLRYLVHPYNESWRHERCIEVPVARALMAAHPGRGLEVGNVLSHYGRVSHRIVDKYERGRGVENRDVLAVEDRDLAYVVSISTLEHVGWDESERDEEKALRALNHLRTLLAPSGRLFVSILLGHHPALTKAVFDGEARAELEAFYRRRGQSLERRWDRIGRQEAIDEFDPAHHELIWMGIVPPA